ncbi:hypothetical protein [Coleofasciculus sp. E2-BRE-01]|uniref:hypothetical protein n=1 Tax=Coleofasciculus sp. E2-BRE-01 TaxID=3069524 RepID=UPI0032F143EB
MIEANKYIFDLLIKYVKKSDISTSIEENKRYIKTDCREKEWLKQLKIVENQPILPKLKTASIKFDKIEYFVVVGWDDSVDFEEEIINPISLNAGLFTALIFDLQVSIRRKVSAYEIVEKILYPIEVGESTYSGHDFNEISDFFEPIYIYEIPEESPFKDKGIQRISGFYISKNIHQLALPFSNDTMKIFGKIFIEGSESIPYENLLLSLTSVSWKYSFLDVYRCIERIFSIFQLDELCQNLSISIPLVKLSAEIENSLGWKPNEEDTLNKILDDSPEETIEIFKEVKQVIDNTSKGKVGTFFYKIRNSIVHYRPATQESKLDYENWDKLIRGSLLVIMYWYERYNLEPGK